ncbi:hypothetical protein [Streptomyces sasae]|uniref:hypothetical protein n=1 Tax=Streptomyces sasae TaxID=1266772 RepID=UPI00293113D2|nr:hypothetical protein [Streptomyces sasae]
MPDLAEAPEIKQWVRSYQKIRVQRGSSLEKLRGYHLRVYSESGSSLGDFDLGSNADEGHYDESTHTYYSSNGYSY